MIGSRRAATAQWSITVALFCAALWLYTRHNNFPFYYHPDEPGKVAQIQNGTRNFHHPLLLLTATELTKRLAGRELDCQTVVEIGRWWSAGFAASAVAAFSWLGFSRFGSAGGIAAGAVMLLQRRAYELAHFMKEDCALLAGIALTFVAIDAFWRRPTVLRAAGLGAAAALATSGKYIGIVMLLPALIALIARRKSLSLGRELLAFGAAFLGVLAAINYPAVLSFSEMVNGITDEVVHLNSRAGVKARFSAFGWVRYILEVSPVLLLFLLVRVGTTLHNLRRRPLPDLLLTAFPLGFGLLLSFSSKQGGRYALPMTEVAALLGVFGALALWRQTRDCGLRALPTLIVLLLVCAGLYDLVRTSILDRGFQHDHRRELVEWITHNVPHRATIALEERVGIPAELPAGRPQRFCELAPPIPQKIRVSRFVSDLGSLDELRAAGVTHIAVAEGRYYVFFEEDRTAERGKEELFARRQTFYQRLFDEGQLVWSRETGDVGVLNPNLRLYEITSLRNE